MSKAQLQGPTGAAEADKQEQGGHGSPSLQGNSGALPPNRPPPRAGAKRVLKIAIADFSGDVEDNEITFSKGDVITVLREQDDGWWLGVLADGVTQGYFPVTFIKDLPGDFVAAAPAAQETAKSSSSSEAPKGQPTPDAEAKQQQEKQKPPLSIVLKPRQSISPRRTTSSDSVTAANAKLGVSKERMGQLAQRDPKKKKKKASPRQRTSSPRCSAGTEKSPSTSPNRSPLHSPRDKKKGPRFSPRGWKGRNKKKEQPPLPVDSMAITKDEQRVGGFGLAISTVQKRSPRGRKTLDAVVGQFEETAPPADVYIVKKKEQSAFPGFRVSTMNRGGGNRKSARSPRQQSAAQIFAQVGVTTAPVTAQSASSVIDTGQKPLSDSSRANIAHAHRTGKLSFAGENFGYLPASVLDIPGLTTLNMASNMIKTLPANFHTKMIHLAELDLSFNRFDCVGDLKFPRSLINLSLRYNNLSEIPPLQDLEQLAGVDLRYNELEGTFPKLPDTVTQLSEVILTANKLKRFQVDCFKASAESLRLIDASENELENLDGLAGISALERIYLAHNNISSLPPSISILSALVVVDLSYNNLTTLPEEFSELSSIRVLRLRSNKLVDVGPFSIAEFSDLRLLDLSHNCLTLPPRGLNLCKVLILSACGVTSIPQSLLELPNLEVLNLGYNEIDLSKTTFNMLGNLKMISLVGNDTSVLPPDYLTNETNPKLTLVDLTPESFKIQGFAETAGLRPYMEDRTVIKHQLGGLDASLFVVFDGHGGEGAAQLAADNVVPLLEDYLQASGVKSLHNFEAQTATLRALDAKICADASLNNCGATAVMVVQVDHRILVANCGDSRAVLCTDGRAQRISFDHKPGSELERLIAADAVLVNNRLAGVIGVSRSLGDSQIPLVIAEPYTFACDSRPDQEQFLIVACDGLWDEVTDQMACDMVMRFKDDPNTAAMYLRDQAFFLGSQDNISVCVHRVK